MDPDPERILPWVCAWQRPSKPMLQQVCRIELDSLSITAGPAPIHHHSKDDPPHGPLARSPEIDNSAHIGLPQGGTMIVDKRVRRDPFCSYADHANRMAKMQVQLIVLDSWPLVPLCSSNIHLDFMASQKFRSPVRVSVTLPWITYERLVNESQNEGRSISNLASFLIESALLNHPTCPPPTPLPANITDMQPSSNQAKTI